VADTRIDDLRRRLDREPGSRVFAQLAEELRKAGQLPEAIRVARQGLLVHPGYPSARMTLGRALMDLRDLRGARAEFEAVLRGATDNILASRFLGECLEGLGDMGSALLQYRATLRLAPGDRNLEAQIRALEQKLTPTVAAAPPPSAPRPAVLPREGAIPVLDVDGPMELETSFDKTTAWRPTPAPPTTTPPLESIPPQVAVPPEPVPLAPEPAAPDNSPTAAIEAAPPLAQQVLEGVPADPGSMPAAEPMPAAASGVLHALDTPIAAAEPVNQSFPAEWDVPEPALPTPALAEAPSEGPATGETPALSSSTLAELYFNQGFTRQAIDVYRELLEREPGNERIAARIHELEAIERELEGVPPAPALPPGDARALRRASIERTITRLEGLLAAVRRA
jgi:tetratricopeptide (TPR) repeat protein